MQGTNGRGVSNGESGEVAVVKVRRAKQEDAAGVMKCLAAAFEPYREVYTPDAFRDTVLTGQDAERRFREMTVLIAEDGSYRIIGTISYQVVGQGEGHLRGMAVIPEFQGGQVAERLLFAAETQLRKLGCSRVTLDTTQPLKRAIRFYLRHGYRATGTMADFFGMPLFEYEKTWDGKSA